MNLVLKKVETENDVESLRNIRNQCRLFMTRNSNYISPEDQVKWFENIDENINVYLAYNIEFGVIVSPIGYGLIRLENGFITISGGLVESERGKGYGSWLFDRLVFLAKEYNKPVRLEVLKSNIKAFGIYSKLGFRVIDDNGKIITMEYYYDSSI